MPSPASTPAAHQPPPLCDLRIVELGGVGPGPFAAMLLADLGAEVIRVERPELDGTAAVHPVLHRNRRSVCLDLKHPAGAAAVLRLVGTADAVIEGFRPGVTERLGLGPDECLARNPGIVYARMTGWGQDGPLAAMPGHDINYVAVAGALGAMGENGEPPPVPLNLVGDMAGGMLLALGLVAGVHAARRTGSGDILDAAMTDGAALQLAMVHGFLHTGRWTDERHANLFDGGAPFYRAYGTGDGGYMAIGAIEPHFYRAALEVLGLADDPVFANQLDRSAWPEMARRTAAVFALGTRAEWTERFAGVEACVTPVIGLTEAPRHPHNAERGTYLDGPGGLIQPAPAPRFHRAQPTTPTPAPLVGAHTDEVLAEIGLGPTVPERNHR